MNVSASVFAADPLNIEKDLSSVIDNVESFHFDVMDGNYTNVYGLNVRLFSRLREITKKPIDVHLMVRNPGFWAKQFAQLGARWVAFHPEVCDEPENIIETIRMNGSLAYVALAIDVKPDAYKDLIQSADGVLILSAPAGGGEFSVAALSKADKVPKFIPIAYDGKISPEVFHLLRNEKKDIAIMGQAIWGTPKN
ncbi:hypothetical protein ACHQJC_17450 [Raoultella planticola]|uniref:hypothetical protein n=1 Tax=Raoultella planticola TaxID=575 RepID=UPI003890761E